MPNRYRLFLALFLISLAWAGCNAITSLRQKLPFTQSGEILFQDDFTDSSSGWRTWDNGDSLIAYNEGGLRFIINETDFDYWSRPGKWFSDVRLEVLATLVSGPSDNDFGLICRYKDDNNFYLFLASNDGYAGILKVQDGVYQVISGPSLEFQPVVAQGQATNYLRADCDGSTLSFYVNNSKVAGAEDAEFEEGDVGLVAGTYDSPGVDVLFDNFVAVQP